MRWIVADWDTGLIFKYPRAIISQQCREPGNITIRTGATLADRWTPTQPGLDTALTDEESRDGIGTKYFNIMWAEENSLYKLKAGIL